MAPVRKLGSLPQHLLSFARVVLGAIVWADIDATGESEWALPSTALAIALDFADGRLARARGTSSAAGKVIDNACDAAFLGFAFLAFAPEIGPAPLAMFALAFGSYGARGLVSATRGWRFSPSPRGHWAGIANYGLALVAAGQASPRLAIPAPMLTGAVVVCAALNALALYDNARLAWADHRAATDA